MKLTIWVLAITNIFLFAMIGVTYRNAYKQGHEAGAIYGFILHGSRTLEVANALHEQNREKSLRLTTTDIADVLDFLVDRSRGLVGREKTIYQSLVVYFLHETESLESPMAHNAKSDESNEFVLAVRKKIVASEAAGVDRAR